MSTATDNILKFIPDKLYLQLKYFYKCHKFLNLKDPRTFDEKIQWIKLFDRNPLYTKLADKYEVKDYVTNIIGKEHIIPTLGVWNSFDEINFDKLPNKFVLKCTHDSGGLIICDDKNKLNLQKAKKFINDSMNVNYYYHSREWCYKDIKPRIIAEEYIESEDGDLVDYKVHVFNGEPKTILVCKDRQSGKMTKDYFDTDWNHIDVSKPGYPNSTKMIEKPKLLKEMLDLSRKLAKDIPFVRTDFYIVKNKIYFGEMTFYPASGFDLFEPEKYNKIFGEWLRLKK